MRARVHFLLLNVGHFLDHLLMLVFATAAALALSREWGLGYAELVPYATPGFVAFGLFALPAGWLADRWSREGMMAVFFFGAGIACLGCSLARGPGELAAGLLVVGIFAAIYHPVGLALVYEMAPKAGMAIAINGVWGNLGVGSAALLTGFMIDGAGWRAAFVAPGLASILFGGLYLALMWREIVRPERRGMATSRTAADGARGRSELVRIGAIVLFTTAVSGIVFQATTFALPKMLDERLAAVATSPTEIGWLAFLVFAIASLAQLAVGLALDRVGPRTVLIVVTSIQVAFFAAMPGLDGWIAWAVALGFMIGAFGQIPINDYVIGRLASGAHRASIYGARFVVTFTALAAALPLIAWIHAGWGFDTLFRVLAAAAILVLSAAILLPRRLPEPA